MDFIFDELFKNLRSCLIFPTIFGFFGLFVITSGNVCIVVEFTDLCTLEIGLYFFTLVEIAYLSKICFSLH